MPAAQNSVHDLMVTLSANRHAYARGWEHMKDPFNKHLLRQLATKRNHPMVELNRALVIAGGLPCDVLHSEEVDSMPTVDPADDNDGFFLARMKACEQRTMELYAELLRDEALPKGLRKLLEEHMRATSTILVIIAEALRTSAARAA
ncbi:MAG: hypothetical protein JNM62_02185 [Flavobacteriales bacterium]|nr:hypothetical protein [Flavobacteriales bacterium]